MLTEPDFAARRDTKRVAGEVNGYLPALQAVDLTIRGLAGCRFSRPRARPVSSQRLCAKN